jgi:hypothetical protein
VTFGTRTRSNLSKSASSKGAGDLDGAVAAEVEEDHRIAILDGADRLAAPSAMTKGGRSWSMVPGCCSRRPLTAAVALANCWPSPSTWLPAFVDHRPVGVVAVHGDVLAAAAGGDAGIEAIGADLGQEGLEGHDIVERAGFRHVAAIEQGVDAHRLDALGLGLHDHRLQVVDVAMHVAVGKQADEMHALFPRPALAPATICCQASPCQMAPEAMASATSAAPWL